MNNLNILQIIKYEGDNDTIIWKHPIEDFNTTTQLIVHESQEAIFFANGQVLDLFNAGRYTLETDNIPLLKKFINIPTDGKTPFHCEVYFINKTEQMAIKWGTDTKLQYIEPTYGFPLYIGASGEMSLSVEDSKQLLLQIVGTENFLSQSKLISYFRTLLMTKIKTYIAQVMKINSINIFEIDENLTMFSEDIRIRLVDDFSAYGLALDRFFVSTVVKPDGDPQYENFKALHYRQYADIAEAKLRLQVGIIDQQTESHKLLIHSQAIAQKRVQEGYTFEQERVFDIAEKAAENEGVIIMPKVIGAIDAAVTSTFNNSSNPFAPQNTSQTAPNTFCENCGASLTPNATFCTECGIPVMTLKLSCENCGYILKKEGNFCPNCGIKRSLMNM